MAGDRKSAVDRAIEAVDSAQNDAPDLQLHARSLLTFTGLANAYANLAERASSECTRDECAAMNVEVKVYKAFAEIQAQVFEHELDARGTAKLQDLEDLITRRDSGAGSFSEEDELPKATN